MSASEFMAVIAIGTSCRRSSRFCAVTTTSSSMPAASVGELVRVASCARAAAAARIMEIITALWRAIALVSKCLFMQEILVKDLEQPQYLEAA